MKRLITIAIGFLFSMQLNAQIRMTEKEDTKLSPTKTDGLLMKDGKMMQMKDGMAVPIEKDITLKNETVVRINGTINTKDGKTILLKNGDWIMMDGRIKHNPAKKKMSKPKVKH